MEQARKALFLDRDGVINEDSGYVYRIEQVRFISGIFELCRSAVDLGFLLFIATNQSGIARGYYSEFAFACLTNWLLGQFQRERCPIASVYYCPYHAEHGIGTYKVDSVERKPNTGMLLRAQRDFDLDFRRSILVGDKESDIQAGKAAGIAANVLFAPDAKAVAFESQADTVVRSLREVTDLAKRMQQR
jgi:D-glycero-D-manno-heptose 1,7-bisphosphate phosphatase